MKIKAARSGGGSAFRRYRNLYYGDSGLGHVLHAELLVTVLGPMPGPAGLLLRGALYPRLFGAAGGKLLIGRNVTFRHFRKIRFGDNVIVDDNAVIDAKGATNTGISIGDNVFVGRNTIVYCKNGDIELGNGVSLSANCTVYSNNLLRIGDGTVVGAYSYLLSGGEYDMTDAQTPFSEQDGMRSDGPLTIGRNCWLGARVTVLDAACIGEHCVIGAGAVVTRPVPANRVAAGVPAREMRSL